jgi:hypothetical protein
MHRLVVVATSIILAGCSSLRPSTAGDEKSRVRNEGYSLLYDLVSDESGVDKILVVKRASPEIVAETKEIAKVFEQAEHQLKSFEKQNNSQINFKTMNLPATEKQTRAAIAKTTTKTLLLSSGKSFERQLLLTQVKALEYASHLAGVVAGQDDDPARKAFLHQFAEQCQQHHKRVIDLLFAL